MASMLQNLPAPTRSYERAPPPPQAKETSVASVSFEPPPYGRRKDFKPTRPEDFGDGGAFPEIPMDQFPLNMGSKRGGSSGTTLAVTLTGDGSANYDAIVKQGANRGKVIATGFAAMVPKIDNLHEVTEHPDHEVVEATKESTMAALQLVVDSKLRSAQPKNLAAGTKPGAAQYIKYTPAQQSRHHNSGADHRIIQMQDMPLDPLEPPKFRHKKVPRGPGSPPVPVLHSPPRPVSKDDQANWKIPPAVSAWKNAKGYTIPLDKRLAADGRGMQEMTINKKHMGLAQALYAAEETARSETELAARLQREIKERERAKKEAQLRQLAAAARMGGGTGAHSLASRLDSPDDHDEGLPPPPPRQADSGLPGPPPGPPRSSDAQPSSRPEERGSLPPPPPRRREADGVVSRDDLEEKGKRDELRDERKRERERERRLEAKNQAGAKRSKITRDRDRDVGEKMALGMANVRGGAGDEQYDSRLFGQDQGIQSGFTGDDAYNVYDKALFADRSTMSMYRPRAADTDTYGGADAGEEGGRTDRFKPDKGFTGTDGGQGASRTGPVQFEKEQEADPFGLDNFISTIGKQ